MYDVQVLGDTILKKLELIDRLSAEVAVMVGEFDADGGWEVEGATSAVAWLRDRAGMTGARPRRWCAPRSVCGRCR